jgi:hypothetical protein
MRHSNVLVRIVLASPLLLVLNLAAACHSQVEREARTAYRQAYDHELLKGLATAVSQYESVVRSYPDTKSAELARAKIASFRAEQERRAQELLSAAQEKPRNEALPLLDFILTTYPETKSSQLASAQAAAAREAIRIELEETERRRKEEEERRALQEARARKLEEERRRREDARLAEQELRRREEEARLQAEQARLRAEEERLRRERQAPTRLVVEYTYSCECSCGQSFLALPKEVRRYTITAASAREAEAKAYDRYGKGPASSKNDTVILGNCPECDCDRAY